MKADKKPRARKSSPGRPASARRAGKSLLVAGLMSGTSADGIDAALVRFTPRRDGTAMNIVGYRTFPWPKGFRPVLMRNSDASTARLDEISALNMLIARLFAAAVGELASSLGYHTSDIDLIGSHGQTIAHEPREIRLAGNGVRSTFQAGDPAVIAKLTGVPTVGNFRAGDIALGGSGAPLVPLFDSLVFSSPRVNRGVLNIGGIANITILPKGAGPGSVRAFDTGPGNMPIDLLMQKYFRRNFDRGGATARRGRINTTVLRRLAHHRYLGLRPPKSTGREMFGEEFIRWGTAGAGRLRGQDLVTTFTEFTALSVYDACIRHVPKRHRPEEVIVSGGGAENPAIMEALSRYFAPAPVVASDLYGVPADAKEAVCFALLAYRAIRGLPGNIPAVTGARRPAVLGVICPP